MHLENVILHSLECMKDSRLPCLLMVTHALGGGVERHVKELQAVLTGRAHVIILRPHVHAQQVLLTAPLYRLVDGVLHTQEAVNLAFKWPHDSSQLREWLDLFGIARVHVHHVLGFPKVFLDYLLALQLPLDLTLHDHSIFTGNPSLLDERGHFDLLWLKQNLSVLPVGDMHVARMLQKLALRAQRVIVPSQALASVVNTMLPSLSVLVRNHPEREIDGFYPSVRPVKLSTEKPFKVLCLGMLGIEKGAFALANTATLAAQQQLDIEFILLGACHVSLPASVRCMGLYQDAELLDLIAEVEPHLLWLPAQCPETWSYTLSAGLRAGLPVLASNLGALPERLIGRPFTQLIKHTASSAQWLASMQQLQASLLAKPELTAYEWPQMSCECFYTLLPIARTALLVDTMHMSYLLPYCAEINNLEILPSGFLQSQHLAKRGAGRWRVLLLRMFYIMSRWPVLARMVHYIPYRWQRRIKRAVSRAPLDSRTLRK